MKENLEAVRLLTKEVINRAATLSLSTYAGAIADEWQDQAEALREGDGGEEQAHEDARLLQIIAEALRELDEERADGCRFNINRGRGLRGTPLLTDTFADRLLNHHSVAP